MTLPPRRPAVTLTFDLSVRLFPLYILNELTFELEHVCVRVGGGVINIACLVYVKVIGQGHLVFDQRQFLPARRC